VLNQPAAPSAARRTAPSRAAFLLAFPAVLAALALAGCGAAASDDEAATAPTVEGTLWSLTDYPDASGSLVTVPDGVTALARFEDGRVAGTGGCNRFNAGYTLEGDALSIEPAASTLIACPPPASDVEAAFFVATATVAGTTLTLADEAGEAVLQFAATEDAPLVGTAWTATGINTGTEAVRSLVEDTEVTATFADDGRVAGVAGCNNYTGSYTTDGTAIEIGPLASTKKLCPGDEIMEQEAQFLAAMENAEQYTVDGTTLELRDAGGALQVSFTAAAAPE
jgi:heat shock protein HslJ